MLKDFGKRFVVSCVLIAILVFLLVYSRQLWVMLAISCFAAALSAVAIWEYLQLLKAKGCKPHPTLTMLLGVLITLSFTPLLQIFFPLAVCFGSFLILFAVHFNRIEGSVLDLAGSTFSLLYIAVPLGMALAIFSFPFGALWMAYLIAVTRSADMGAYFIGSLWGKKKLAPLISPSKTWEGAIAGLIVSLCVSFLFYLIGLAYSFPLGSFEWLLLGLTLSIAGQFGDLCESLLKRDAHKKDSNALPGLGGVLDTLDSLLLNFPILYLYLALVKEL